MEPITREEYYLAKIAGTYEGKTPKPVTNDEYYLATMAGDYSGNTPQPVTRLQYYMAKVAGVWGRKHPCACDTIRILLGGDCQRRGESLSACDTRGAFLGAGSRCVQRCAHGRYRQPRPLGKFKGESWAGIPYPLRQINADEHDWGTVISI